MPSGDFHSSAKKERYAVAARTVTKKHSLYRLQLSVFFCLRLLWSPYVIGQTIIFSSCFFLLWSLYLCSAGRPSGWALAHILVYASFFIKKTLAPVTRWEAGAIRRSCYTAQNRHGVVQTRSFRPTGVCLSACTLLLWRTNRKSRVNY